MTQEITLQDLLNTPLKNYLDPPVEEGAECPARLPYSTTWVRCVARTRIIAHIYYQGKRTQVLDATEANQDEIRNLLELVNSELRKRQHTVQIVRIRQPDPILPLQETEDPKIETSRRYQAFSDALCKIKQKNPSFDIEKAEAWFNP